MGFSLVVRLNLSSSVPQSCFQYPSTRLNEKQNNLIFLKTARRKQCCLHFARSVLNNTHRSVNGNGAAGAAEPVCLLLERLFEHTQKLEKGVDGNFNNPDVEAQPVIILEMLESDLHAALMALKKREEDLEEAETRVLLEQNNLNQAKVELEQREKEISEASVKHEKLEEDLKRANIDLASQARRIEELRYQLKERDSEIEAIHSSLMLKEAELEEMRTELAKKNDDVFRATSELHRNSRLLNRANEVVKKQEVEIHALQKFIREKEEELRVSSAVRKLEMEKLKVTEANLEKQTKEWLLAQEEVEKMGEEVSRHMGEANETLEDFTRVKKLLADVRTELVLSQQALVFSRQHMKEKENLFGMQLEELEGQKRSVISYLNNLKDAQIEVENERAKLRVAEAKNKDLEQDLLMEKDLMEELQMELRKEKSSLDQAVYEISILKEELEIKSNEFQEAQNLLQDKESSLVEAKLEIHNLKSEQASLQLILQEKDIELLEARNKLEILNQEVTDLKMLLSGREDQLMHSTTMLKVKDEHVKQIQEELDDTKVRANEAEIVMESIVALTSKLVTSTKEEDDMGFVVMQPVPEKPHDFRLQNKQLETELEFTRDNLRIKEMEVLAAQRALTIKDEEVKAVSERLEAKEHELRRLKEEMNNDANDLKRLYALAQERIGGKTMGELAIEKLQLEAAQVEIEAATSALEKLAEMSKELLSIEGDSSSVVPENVFDSEMGLVENTECIDMVGTEVARLSNLTEKLVKDAGIVDDTG